MLFMLDNYDSFTYNLVHYLGEMGEEVVVRRNDEVDLDWVARLGPSRIVISPGPCRPAQAGISIPLVRAFAGRVPILGVCLGHQAIGEAFGGRIVRASTLMHGKTSLVRHDGRGLFQGLPNPLVATRYHSLVIESASVPACLEVTALSEDGDVMAVRHTSLPVAGVQFHPESILTESGKDLLANFLAAT